MGSASSKGVNGDSTFYNEEGEMSSSNEQDSFYDEVQIDSVNKFDKQIINTIKKDLSETPELFVLNNMLMSIMFFENYQKEIQEISSIRYEKGENCIAPDVILEKVNKNVRYRPLHGPKKYSSEPLMPKRLYAIDHSVKVINSLENPIYKSVRVEESSRKGFVKLKEIEPSTAPSDEDIPVATEPSPSTSRSSTESDTAYGYSTLTDLKTPRPIEIIDGLQKKDALPNLPLSCISYRRIKKLPFQVDIDDQEADNLTEDDLYDIVSYINSKEFMKYFQNNLFPNRIGIDMGFDQINLRLARAMPGKVFCNLNQGDNNMPCEVIPGLLVHWPHEQTLEFGMKGQKPVELRKRYIFPTERMIEEIKALSCVLVPKGYIKKKGAHGDSDIEWEIHCPQAERYLETFMSHAQAKCFLFLLTLHKTYIEPKTFQLGLLTEHIRSFLLWECETNYSDWPEHRLGTKLVNVLKNFNTHIAKSHLPDYFISKKNLFESTPKKYLRHAQKVFHEILETPLMSFIKSLRNLRYTRGKSFYPPFEFDQLYSILVKSGIESANPQLISESSIPPNYKKRKDYDSDTLLKHIREVKRREKIIQEKREKMEKENLTETDERRESVDSINMEWICEKQFDVSKKGNLLTFFINNFIDIAKKCSEISSSKQTLFYLKQARYLTKIMGDECPALGDEVEDFLKIIKVQEDNCNKRAVRKGADSPISHESGVKFTTSLNNSNHVIGSRNNESSARVNGAQPRKSVAFVEIH